MNKEKFYTRIKKTMYRKFNKLQVIDLRNGNDVYLRYIHDDNVQVLIKKKYGYVYYYYGFKIKIIKHIPMNQLDFEILLSQWIEEKFEIKVNDIQKQYLCTG